MTSNDGVQIFYTTIEGEPLVLAHDISHAWESWQGLGYVVEPGVVHAAAQDDWCFT